MADLQLAVYQRPPRLPNQYVCETIIGHTFTNQKLQLLIKWRYWPVAAGQLEDYDNMKVTAKDVVHEYLQRLGVPVDTPDDQLAALLEPFPAADVTVLDEDVKIVAITAHEPLYSKNKFARTRYHYETEWSNGEKVSRPKSAFIDKEDKKIVDDYMVANGLLHVPAYSSRRSPRRDLGGSRLPHKIAKKDEDEAYIGDDANICDEDGATSSRPVSPVDRKISPIYHARNARIQKETKGKNPVGRPRKSSQFAATKVLAFAKSSNREELAVVEDKYGNWTTMLLEDVNRTNPKLVYNALKKKAFAGL